MIVHELRALLASDISLAMYKILRDILELSIEIHSKHVPRNTK